MNLVQPFRYLFWYQSLPLDLSPFRFLDSLTLLIYVIYVSSFGGIGYVTPIEAYAVEGLSCFQLHFITGLLGYRVSENGDYWFSF